MRSTSGEALGAMVNGVSSDELKELWGWLFKTLQSDDTPVDRSGAAQGIAYVLKAQVSSLNHTYFKPHLLRDRSNCINSCLVLSSQHKTQGDQPVHVMGS